MSTQNIIIILDTECVLACRYCYISKQYRASTALLNYDTIFTEVESETKQYDVLNIEVSGRLDRHTSFLQDLFGHCRLCKNTNFNFFFQLNGTELTDEVLSIIKDYHVNVGISSDGFEEVNNRLRVYKGKEKSGFLINQSMEKMRENNIGYSVRCTISSQNVQDVDSLLASLRSMQPVSVFLNRMIYKKDALTDYSQLMVPIENYLSFYDLYHRTAIASGDFHLVDVNLKRWFYRFSNHPRGWTHFCSTGRCELGKVITPVGIYPCPKFLGSAIVSKSQVDTYKKINCSSCPVASICQGGCPLGNNYRADGLSDECLFVRFLYDFYQEQKKSLKYIIK